MKEKIILFIHNLILYDYLLFGSTFALFILFILLAIVLRNRVGIALFFILFGFAILLLTPTVGYLKMHEYLFKNFVVLTSQKQLNFVNAIVLKGTLSNESRFDFKECRVTATVYKFTSNKFKNYIFRLKPLKKSALFLEDIPKGTTREFKMFVEPFRYSKEYNISLGASCK
ncbi:DUF2393 domain-containing protein [Sulfurimonas sp.]